MFEFFDRINAGDPIKESHLRKLNQVTRRVSAAPLSGSFLISHANSSGQVTTSPPYHKQDIVEVLGVLSDKIYEVKVRYYDHDSESWKTDKDMNIQYMDGSDVDALLLTGDKTVAYWDNQRKMWIPVGGKSTDPMWCARICECVIERAGGSCCVYRGTVKRVQIPESGVWTPTTLCDPPTKVLPAFVLAECTTDLTAAGGAEGWVRKIDDDVEITWTPPGLTEPITEKLGLYEWCCWGPGECPDISEQMTVSITHSVPPGDTDPTHQCPEATGIELQLSYRDQVDSEPLNNVLCAYEGWYGEFGKESSIPIRLYGMDYAPAENPGGPESEFGWIRPNWLTGEASAFFDGDQNPISEPSAYTLTGDCTIMLDAEGNTVEESVTRYYRLSVTCSNGQLFSPCIQHIYPPGHPIYAAVGNSILAQADAPIEAMSEAIALEDHLFHSQLTEICTNDFVSKFGALFGNQHSTSTVLGPGNVPDGIFQGTWPDMHTFIGCFDFPKGAECDLLITDWNQNWQKYTAHWTWK